jgi:hypothetical protein
LDTDVNPLFGFIVGTRRRRVPLVRENGHGITRWFLLPALLLISLDVHAATENATVRNYGKTLDQQNKLF